MQASSIDQYRIGWSHWQRWAVLFGTTPLMQVIPAAWFAQGTVYPFFDTCIACFMVYLYTELKLSPVTISNYVSGVRFNLRIAKVNVSFLETSALIQSVRSGIVINHASTRILNKVRTQPFTADMLLHGIRYVFPPTSLRNQGIMVALELTFCCLLRSSECVPMKKSHHFLKGQDVIFSFSHNEKDIFSRLYPWELNPGYLYCLHSVTVSFNKAKCDLLGVGDRVTLPRCRKPDPHRAFDICTDMFVWAAAAAPTPTGSFFCHHTGKPNISYDILLDATKEIASSVGLDSTLYSPHSLRYGGATTLGAKDVADSVIKAAGRWNSDIYKQYIRPQAVTQSSNLNILSDVTTLTVEDVFQTTPGVRFVSGHPVGAIAQSQPRADGAAVGGTRSRFWLKNAN